ncbi:hypothetical protein M0804_000688 [Polistes exclamans]|nr:hypothetical protein M0804_000688 [Polistes exclamans]
MPTFILVCRVPSNGNGHGVGSGGGGGGGGGALQTVATKPNLVVVLFVDQHSNRYFWKWSLGAFVKRVVPTTVKPS